MHSKWSGGVEREPNLAKVAPKSSLGAFEVFGCLRCVFLFVKIVRRGHGALVGLTEVKGTSVDNHFFFFFFFFFC